MVLLFSSTSPTVGGFELGALSPEFPVSIVCCTAAVRSLDPISPAFCTAAVFGLSPSPAVCWVGEKDVIKDVICSRTQIIY